MNRSKEVALYHYANGEDLSKTAKHFTMEKRSVRRRLREFKEKKSLAKILLLDIETSQIHFRAWDTGKQYVSWKQITKHRYMICWAGKWLYSAKSFGECVTPEESLRRDDTRITQGVWNTMDEADIIVGHNVRNFDIKQINTGILGGDIEGGVPPSPYNVIDTLAVSRTNFKQPSHSLAYLLEWLSLSEKLKTEQGLWNGCEAGNKKDLKYMFKYCKGDIFGTEELYLKLRPWIRSHPNVAIYGEMQNSGCPHCESPNVVKVDKPYRTPLNSYQSYRCNDCGTPSHSRFSSVSAEQRRNILKSNAR